MTTKAKQRELKKLDGTRATQRELALAKKLDGKPIDYMSKEEKKIVKELIKNNYGNLKFRAFEVFECYVKSDYDPMSMEGY